MTWKRLFKEEALKKGEKYVDKVNIVENNGFEIIGKIDGFNYEIAVLIQHDSPYLPRCDCDNRNTCEHEAALYHYIEKHPELLKRDYDLKNIVDATSEENIKEFLIREMDENEELKNRFLKEFNDNGIDRQHYLNKLKKILKIGEGPDFDLHESYYFDAMKYQLSDFINNDIMIIINIGEYDFACELLCKIGDVLTDEISVGLDSWNYLAETFLEIADPLTFSIHIDKDKIEDLNLKTSWINGYFY